MLFATLCHALIPYGNRALQQEKGGQEPMCNAKRTLTVVVLLVVTGLLMTAGLGQAADDMININTATAEELAKLEGIGPSYAARIVEYREKNGPFEKPEDLMKVSGIGAKTFEANKDRITVGK